MTQETQMQTQTRLTIGFDATEDPASHIGPVPAGAVLAERQAARDVYSWECERAGVPRDESMFTRWWPGTTESKTLAEAVRDGDVEW